MNDRAVVPPRAGADVPPAPPLWSEVLDIAPGAIAARREPAFLFVHGDFSTGPVTWSRQWSGLAGLRRLIVVDRRGHGRSPAEPSPYTLRADARDILRVAAERAGGPVALVGHSYGAIACIEAALIAPERVAALHLIEPPLLGLAPGDPAVAALADAARALHAAAPQLPAEELARRFFALVAGDAAAEALRERPVWQALVAEAARFGREEFAGEYPPDRPARLRHSLPVTIYSGSESHPALRRLARRLHELLPQSRLLSFPGAAHDVQRLGEPFNRALLAYS